MDTIFSSKNLSVGKNIRLFKNPILEKLTYVPPILPLLIWAPIVSLCLSLGLIQNHITLTATLLTGFAGLFFWTFAEYFLHRFVFHFHPHGVIQERIAFLIHGIHHDDPEDARRLLMPPVAAIAIASVFYVMFYAAFGTVYCNPFFGGFIIGYLLYDYTHFAVHFARPRSKLMKKLKHNHMQHHFVSPELRYGVSNTFWDHVFKTVSK